MSTSTKQTQPEIRLSRIGKRPIALPQGVKATVHGTAVVIKGPKGELSQTFDPAVVITADSEPAQLMVMPKDASRFARAAQGTVAAIIKNMVRGVQEPFFKNLEISGTGYKAELKGALLHLSLGKSHPIALKVPESIKVTITENTKVRVEGIDRQQVGQFAANIKHCRKREPYKGKGVHIVGEIKRTKEGKKTA
jgi:large subunit ribosomal protein L6